MPRPHPAPTAAPTPSAPADFAAHGHPVLVRLTGEVDVHTSGQVRRRLADLIALGHRDLVVDLGAVTFIDSTGLGVLVHALKLVHGRGGRVRLVTAQPSTLKLLRITSLTKLFTVHATVGTALEEV